ncbi:MAG: hypothetical protein AAF899_06750 [Pseudomonadota bacterium]
MSATISDVEEERRLAGLRATEALAEIPASRQLATGEMPVDREETLPGPVSQAFFFSDADLNLIMGPVGSGKTTTTVKSRIRRAVMMPRSTIDGIRHYSLGTVRKTYRELWSTTIPSYLETVPKALGSWSGGRGDPVTHVVEFEDNFGPILWTTQFLAFGDDPTNAMRGLQFTDMWLNEFDTNPEDILMLAVGRIARAPALDHFRGYPPHLRSYGQIVGDMNAPAEDNWAYAFTQPEQLARIERETNAALADAAEAQGDPYKPVKFDFHRQPGAREPGAENLDNLGSTYYARQVATMKAAGRGDMIERLIDNRPTFLRVGDPVFRREFNPSIHVSARPIQADPDLGLIIGLDQGFTPAAVIGQHLGPLQWVVLAELMFPKEHLFAKTFGERLADLLDRRFPSLEVHEAWGDLAGEAEGAQAEENATWNREVGKAAGFIIKPQVVGGNRINPRLEAVRAPLEHLHEGQPGLLIDPSCTYTRAGFQARYVWTEEVTPTGNKRKVPNKKYVEANVMDALQYMLLSKHQGAVRGSYQPRASSSQRGRPPPPEPDAGSRWSTTDPYAEAWR